MCSPNFTYEAFLSYPGALEKDIVAVLLDKLKQQNLLHRVYYNHQDKRGGGPGRHFRDNLENGLKNSRYLVAFLTPDYLESPWCVWELTKFWIMMEEEQKQNMIPDAKRKTLLPIFYDMKVSDFTRRGGSAEKHLTKIRHKLIEPHEISFQNIRRIFRDELPNVMSIVATRTNRPLNTVEIVDQTIDTVFPSATPSPSQSIVPPNNGPVDSVWMTRTAGKLRQIFTRVKHILIMGKVKLASRRGTVRRARPLKASVDEQEECRLRILHLEFS